MLLEVELWRKKFYRGREGVVFFSLRLRTKSAIPWGEGKLDPRGRVMYPETKYIYNYLYARKKRNVLAER